MSNELFNWTMNHLLDIVVLCGIGYGVYRLHMWWNKRGKEAKSINSSSTLTEHSHTTDTTKLKQEVKK